MTESHNSSTFRVLAACLLGAAMFAVLPASATTPVRDTIRLAVSPGQRLVRSSVTTLTSRWQKMLDKKLADQQLQIEYLQSEIAASNLKERRALLAVEKVSQEIVDRERHGVSPFEVKSAPSLIRSRAVRASILGREILSEMKSRQILDKGNLDGVSADLWVLDSDLPIIQAGSEWNVTDGMPVFTGRCIVGRIIESGRWASSLQLMTEPGFRARAIIGRVSSEASDGKRFAFGAEGLIEGRSGSRLNGLCELTQIPAAEHVDVGMPVYSPPTDSVDAAMLFGHVVAAEIPGGALHWVIMVQPAAELTGLRSVEIVVPELSTDFAPTNLVDRPRLSLPLSNQQTLPTRETTSRLTQSNLQLKERVLSDRQGGSDS